MPVAREQAGSVQSNSRLFPQHQGVARGRFLAWRGFGVGFRGTFALGGVDLARHGVELVDGGGEGLCVDLTLVVLHRKRVNKEVQPYLETTHS
jgi:hypothetical protein